jgi:hypothetical protein
MVGSLLMNGKISTTVTETPMKRRLHSSYQSSVDNSIPETVERERERSRIRSNGIPSQLLDY